MLALALALAACAGDEPGYVRLTAYDPQDSDQLWTRRFHVANAFVSTAPEAEGRLLIDGYDLCPDANLLATLDARTGDDLEVMRDDGEPIAPVGGGNRCPPTVLSTGERRALCAPDGSRFSVIDPDTNREVFHVDAPDTFAAVNIAGDHLLVQRSDDDGHTLAFEWLSLLDGSEVWTNTTSHPAPELGAQFLGLTGDTLLFFTPYADSTVNPADLTFALSAEDGELTWKRDLLCGGDLEVAADVLVCIESEAHSACPDST